MKKLYVLVGLTLLLAGCASEPTEEIQQAEAALTKAKQADASQWAPEAYQRAEAKMAEARQMVQDGEYTEAVPVLVEAEQLADDAVQAAAQAKEKAEEEKRRAEEAARKKAEAEMEAPKNSHTVANGECLWYIAGYEEVYGDPYQWTRIYNANQDKIADPDLIYPGQVFDIPR